MFDVNPLSVVSTNTRKPHNCFGRKDERTDGWMEKIVYMCPPDSVGNGSHFFDYPIWLIVCMIRIFLMGHTCEILQNTITIT